MVAERRPHLVTVLGPPGIGKTRLSREFVTLVEASGGRTLQGRSLPYGETAGYRAFAQFVNEVAGIFESDAAPVIRITKTTPGPLPVCWRAGSRTSGCSLLDGLSSEIALPVGTACPAWIYLNAGGTGYYRSEWSDDERLALPNLTPAERLTLVYDLRANKSEPGRRVLQELASDSQPEIAAAARDALR